MLLLCSYFAWVGDRVHPLRLAAVVWGRRLGEQALAADDAAGGAELGWAPTTFKATITLCSGQDFRKYDFD